MLIEMDWIVSTREKELEEAKDKRERFVRINNVKMKDRKLFSRKVRELDDRINELEKALKSARQERLEVLRNDAI